jgi:hypothetical protein
MEVEGVDIDKILNLIFSDSHLHPLPDQEFINPEE